MTRRALGPAGTASGDGVDHDPHGHRPVGAGQLGDEFERRLLLCCRGEGPGSDHELVDIAGFEVGDADG